MYKHEEAEVSTCDTYVLIETIATVDDEEQDGHRNHRCCNGHDCRRITTN